jgi:hypothetical protein
MTKQILVTKASGEKEAFNTDKLRSSLNRAGAEKDLIEMIVQDIVDWAIDGISTKKIYTRAFSILRRKKAGPALKYKLKQAIMELGPTGYPFEHFVGILFKKQGLQVEVGKVIEGNCVTHEMDVIATGNKNQDLVECKYHQYQGKQVSVQVPLYVRSRIDDIIRLRMKSPEYQGFKFQGWIFTNTRFTSDSIQFGKCSGLKLVAWDYPAGHGLKDMIEKENIFPITILHSLTKKEKQKLMEEGIVTCAVLRENLNALEAFNFSNKKRRAIIKNLNDICG